MQLEPRRTASPVPSFQNGNSFLRHQTALINRSKRAPESSCTACATQIEEHEVGEHSRSSDSTVRVTPVTRLSGCYGIFKQLKGLGFKLIFNSSLRLFLCCLDPHPFCTPSVHLPTNSTVSHSSHLGTEVPISPFSCVRTFHQHPAAVLRSAGPSSCSPGKQRSWKIPTLIPFGNKARTKSCAAL